MVPVNLVESVPPKVNSPFLTDVLVVGSKDTERRSAEIVPCEKRTSMTVGTGVCVSGVKVPIVKSTGPSLWSIKSAQIHSDRLHTHPRTPSKPSKPAEVEATPIDARRTRVGLRVTVSSNSVPEEGGKGFSLAKMTFVERNSPQNDPDPYVTHWQICIS